MSIQIDALPEYITARKNLVYVAERLGYVAGYGSDNYIKTYGNLTDNEAAYLLLNIERGCKGSISWNQDTGFVARWTNKHSPHFENRETFLSYLLEVPELKP